MANDATTPNPPVSGCGPTALLKVFQDAKFPTPCQASQTWLLSLPETMPFEEMWKRCREPSWLGWVTGRLGLKTKGAGTCDAIRAAVPWLEVALALANPPESVECLDCGDVVKFDELYDGRCEDCDGNYVYCCICDERQHRDHLCDHLEWSSSASEEVGTGSGSDDIHKESFDRLLGVLGLRRARKLRAAIANKSWFGGGHYRLEERVEALREKASDTNDRDGTEVGLIWLSTLGDDDKLRPCVEKTLVWIDEHLAARKARIAADHRPRRVLRDGQRRYYVQRTDTWTSIREHASWMRAPAAHRLAKLLSEAYPKAVVKVVHVLTPHQKVTR